MNIKLAKEDYRFVLTDPDPGFSPERNKAIVEETIKKYEETRRKKVSLWREGLAERADALAFYIKYAQEHDTPAERYFSRRMIAYLRGDTLRNQLMVDRVLKANTNKLYSKIIHAEKKT